MPDSAHPNLDPDELERFDSEAPSWWDPEGPFRPLHELNPARLQYVLERCQVRGSETLDVGCGGGILAESLASCGARVTAIDIAPTALAVARLHLHESGLDVDYRETTVERLAESDAGRFDLVTCMEMLEHVPDPESVVRAVARLLKPGGHAILSTLNRTPAAFLLGIVGAEYLARLLPRGTHRYDRFIRPSELARCARSAGFSVRDIRGLHYDPLSRSARLGGHTRVNYLMHLELLSE